MDCLFCKITAGEIPSEKIYEDEFLIGFRDISPQAPVHFLVIPKEHITSLDEVDESHKNLLGHIMLTIPKIAKDQGLENGYRLVVNCKEDGGQTVDHIHYHILGKRNMLWPPG